MKTMLHLSRRTTRRLSMHSGLVCVSMTILALAGCATRPAASTKSPTSPSAATNAVSPASGPGLGSGYSNYGTPLSSKSFLRLTSGNTLFRPLADGGRTRVFVSPSGDLIMHVTNPSGHTVTESGRQTAGTKEICWTLKGKARPICFHPYWNGRLLTLQFIGNAVLPAQFLVEQGKNLPSQ